VRYSSELLECSAYRPTASNDANCSPPLAASACYSHHTPNTPTQHSAPNQRRRGQLHAVQSSARTRESIIRSKKRGLRLWRRMDTARATATGGSEAAGTAGAEAELSSKMVLRHHSIRSWAKRGSRARS
jgi:hypothetical protein